MIVQGLLLVSLAVIPAPEMMRLQDGFLPMTTCVEQVLDSQLPSEGYELDVNPNGRIVIRSSDAAGAFYARKTLDQLVDWRGYRCVKITDRPRYKWRGLLLDECRHFFGKEIVKRMLDVMSQYKFNVFHWHLTDDQGWRIDVPGYPELVKYGSVRPASPRHGARIRWIDESHYTMDLNDETYGPYYYTEADIREIVSYAAERQIKVVPEIELPGHLYAALAAYPQYACRSENLSKRTVRMYWGVEEDVLCPGNDEAIKFLESIFDYVCRVFPSDIVHIGGDECPRVRWKTCPKCQKRIVDEGLKDERGLQTWITRHFADYLAVRGKRVLGWDEYLLGEGIPKSAMGMSWRVGQPGGMAGWLSPAEIAAKGHDLVMVPCDFCYLDYTQGLPEDPYQYINILMNEQISLRKCHSFDPCAGIPESARSHVIGGQGNNWSEYTWNRFDLEWKMWPRACALAEVLWSGERKPSFEDFLARMVTHRRRLLSQGINCAPLE